MASGKILTFSVVAILLVATLGSSLEISQKYVGGPTLSEATQASYASFALRNVDFSRADKPEQTLEILKSLNVPDEFWIQFYLDLANADKPCGKDLGIRFMYSYNQMKGSNLLEAKSKQAMLSFMEHYGGEKLSKCVPWALAAIRAAKGANKDVVAVEEFFKQAVSLDKNADDSSFFRELSSRSGYTGKWNTNWLVSQASKYNAKDYLLYDAPHRDVYHYMFLSNCLELSTNLAKPLDIINLASILKPESVAASDAVSFRELNEIRRICLELWRNDEDFYSNLYKQMNPFRKVVISGNQKARLLRDKLIERLS